MRSAANRGEPPVSQLGAAGLNPRLRSGIFELKRVRLYVHVRPHFESTDDNTSTAANGQPDSGRRGR